MKQSSNNKKVVVVLGTTASGKTRMAVEIAKKYNGEIISADSRQVYKGMDIGTGKDLDEFKVQSEKLKVIPYHLIDVASPKKQFTVAQFQKKAYEAIDDILSRNKLPIICGGTGLYIDAITRGLQFGGLRITNLPRRQAGYGLRKKRNSLNKKTLPQLLVLLKRIDNKTYKVIDKKNRRRIQRALEIYYETGIPKSKQPAPVSPPYEFLKIGITYPKEILAKRIEKRLDERLRQGMVDEVKKLHGRGVSWKRLDDFGLEYRWVSKYLRKIISRQEMRNGLAFDIIHFAKRQMTWFKRDSKIYWVKNIKEARALTKKYL